MVCFLWLSIPLPWHEGKLRSVDGSNIHGFSDPENDCHAGSDKSIPITCKDSPHFRKTWWCLKRWGLATRPPLSPQSLDFCHGIDLSRSPCILHPKDFSLKIIFLWLSSPEAISLISIYCQANPDCWFWLSSHQISRCSCFCYSWFANPQSPSSFINFCWYWNLAWADSHRSITESLGVHTGNQSVHIQSSRTDSAILL